MHRADGHDCRRLPEDRRAVGQDRPQIHDGRDGRLRPRVSVHQTDGREGGAWHDPVRPGQPPAGYGRLAQLLAGPPADALCDPLRGPVPGARTERRRGGELLWIGPDSRGTHRHVRLAVRDRKCPRETQEQQRGGPRHPLALRYGTAVPRELRCLRLEEELRVATLRGGGAGAPHGQAAGARDSEASVSARLRPPSARAAPALHDRRCLRRRRASAPVVHPGGRPRRQPSASGARVRDGAR